MTTSPPSTAPASQSLTNLEQEVLDEYELLLQNMNEFSALTAALASMPTTTLLDSLRKLERKTGLVFTLLKASVYSMVLQQQLNTGGFDAEEGEGEDSFEG
ncbi:hypothetical protein RUND412_002482 [Rhizina undulata]